MVCQKFTPFNPKTKAKRINILIKNSAKLTPCIFILQQAKLPFPKEQRIKTARHKTKIVLSINESIKFAKFLGGL
jgi:hypothetical protein